MPLHSDLTKALIALNRGESVNNDLIASIERGFRSLQTSANIFNGWIDTGTEFPRLDGVTIVESTFINPPLESVFLYSYDELTASAGFEEFFFKDKNEFVGPADAEKYEYQNRKLVRSIDGTDIFISKGGKDRIFFFSIRMSSFGVTATTLSCYVDFKDKSGASITTDFPTYLFDDYTETQNTISGSAFMKIPDNAYSFSILVDTDTDDDYSLWLNVTRIA